MFRMNTFLQDLRFGMRILLKQPWSLLAAILALSIGIGLVTMMFCFFNGTILQSLPLQDSDQLAYTTIPVDAFQPFKEQQSSFERLCSFGSTSENFKAKSTPSRRRVCFITSDFLETVRVNPLLGRGFQPGEDQPGSDPVALLGYDVWQEEFAGDPAAIGSIIWVGGQAKTVVGIMPRDFHFPINESIWVASNQPSNHANHGQGFIFGRLKSSVGMDQAKAELNTIWKRLLPPEQAQDPALEPIRVGRFVDFVWGRDGPTKSFEAFAGGALASLATFFVLFIACTNVALLTLGRAAKRGREFAVRGALGATRRRLIFQVLVENLILSAGGAAGGLLAANWLIKWFSAQISGPNLAGNSMPFWWHYEIDWRVVVFVMALSFLTNLLAGLAPAIQGTKHDVNELLKDQSSGSSGLRIAGFQRFLVISQVAMSVAIFAGTFVLIRTGNGLAKDLLPFEPREVLSAKVDLVPPADPARFITDLERDLQQDTRIKAVGFSSGRLQRSWSQVLIEVEGKSYQRWQDHPQVGSRAVSDGFFDVLNLKLLQGRAFSPDDRPGTLATAVVSPAFAERFLPSGNPLGARFREYPEGPWLTVVGVVSDVWGPAQHSSDYYVSMRQQPRRDITVMLRGESTAALAGIIRGEITRLHPNLPVFEVGTLQEQWKGTNHGVKMEVQLLSVCGGGSLFLSVLGIYGLISLSVGQRRREIGIRLALGGTHSRIIWNILKVAVHQISIGLVCGCVLAYCLLQIVRNAVETRVDRPWPYLAAVLLLGAFSLIAVILPARNAMKSGPMEALRHE